MGGRLDARGLAWGDRATVPVSRSHVRPVRSSTSNASRWRWAVETAFHDADNAGFDPETLRPALGRPPATGAGRGAARASSTVARSCSTTPSSTSLPADRCARRAAAPSPARMLNWLQGRLPLAVPRPRVETDGLRYHRTPAPAGERPAPRPDARRGRPDTASLQPRPGRRSSWAASRRRWRTSRHAWPSAARRITSARVSELPESVRIREVGPRDGFQNEPEVIPTADKVRLIGDARRGRAAADRAHLVRAPRRDPAARRRRGGPARLRAPSTGSPTRS